MNGYEIKKMVNLIQTRIKKYFIINRVFSKNEKGEYFLYDIKYFDGNKEFEFFQEKEYLIALNDYLIIKGGDGYNKVLLWYKPRNLNCNYGVDVYLIEKYLKDNQIIDTSK